MPAVLLAASRCGPEGDIQFSAPDDPRLLNNYIAIYIAIQSIINSPDQ